MGFITEPAFGGQEIFAPASYPFRILRGNAFFIADFYCAEEKLVIELDGPVHEQQQDYDLLRTWIINQLGMKVIRFRNEELENPGEVLAKIEKEFG